MRTLLLLPCLLMMLAACAPRQRAVLPTETLPQPAAALQRSRNATAAPTLSPAPASIPTMRPLAELPLDGLLFQPGDLPAEVLAGPIDHNPSFPLEDKAPAPDAALAQTFNLEGYPRGYGFVNIWWFDAQAAHDDVYHWLVEPPNVEGAVQPPLGRRLAQLAATPDEQLWVITDEFTPGNTVQRLLTSRDGGAHWGEYRLGELLPSYGGAWHGRLSFADAQHGWLISTYGEVYYTQDGGASWTGW
jgi:hypothetical protein